MPKDKPIPSTADIVKERETDMSTSVSVIEPAPMGSIIERLALDPNCNMDNLERLYALQQKDINREAEILFNKSFVAAQMEMGPVVKDAKNDQTRSRYALLETITKKIKPIYTNHGFAMLGDEGDNAPEGNVHVVMDIIHSGGHSRKHHYNSPLDDKGIKGTVNKTKPHAKGSAVTYAQRYLKCLIWDVQISDDDDGNAAGQDLPTLTEKQVADMESALLEMDNGEYRILKMVRDQKGYDVTDLEDIRQADYKYCMGAIATTVKGNA